MKLLALCVCQKLLLTYTSGWKTIKRLKFSIYVIKSSSAYQINSKFVHMPAFGVTFSCVLLLPSSNVCVCGTLIPLTRQVWSKLNEFPLMLCFSVEKLEMDHGTLGLCPLRNRWHLNRLYEGSFHLECLCFDKFNSNVSHLLFLQTKIACEKVIKPFGNMLSHHCSALKFNFLLVKFQHYRWRVWVNLVRVTT